MKKTTLPKRLTGFAAGMTAAAVLICFLHTVTMLLCYEDGVQLYVRDAVLPGVTYALMGGYIVIALAASVLLSRGQAMPTQLEEAGRGSAFLASMSGILLLIVFLGSGVGYAMDILGLPSPIPMLSGMTLSTQMRLLGKFFVLLKLIFMLPSGCWLIRIALNRRETRMSRTAFASCFTLWLLTDLVARYFDMTGPFNSPPKVIRQIAVSLLILVVLCLMRFDLRIAKPAAWVGFTLSAFMMGLASSVSELVMTLSGRMTLNIKTLESAVLLGISLFVAARLWEAALPPKKESSEKSVSESETEVSAE